MLNRRNSISNDIKMKILKDKEAGITPKELSSLYNINKSSLYKIINSEKENLNSFSKKNPSKCRKKTTEFCSNLNSFLINYVSECNRNGFPVSGRLIRATVLKFANFKNNTTFKASNGWLDTVCKKKTQHL